MDSLDEVKLVASFKGSDECYTIPAECLKYSSVLRCTFEGKLDGPVQLDVDLFVFEKLSQFCILMETRAETPNIKIGFPLERNPIKLFGRWLYEYLQECDDMLDDLQKCANYFDVTPLLNALIVYDSLFFTGKRIQ